MVASSWPSTGQWSERVADVTDRRPVGVFDSGVGGLTVLREIVRRLPRESTVYLGDNLRAPYGTRSDEEVLRFTGQALDRLVERDVKAIVDRLQHRRRPWRWPRSAGGTRCRSSA